MWNWMACPPTLGIIAKIIINFDVIIVSALQKEQHSIHTDSRDRVSSDRQEREKVSRKAGKSIRGTTCLRHQRIFKGFNRVRLISTGRLFQRKGPQKEKALKPVAFILPAQ